MVEGPGCTLNGEKITAKFKGKIVKKISGNAVDQSKPKSTGQQTDFQQLLQRKLDNVLTLGKELFMFFGDLCLRIHFLMNGSIRVNNTTHLGHKASEKVNKTPRLEIQFCEDVLKIYESSVDIRSSDACRQKYESLYPLDVCSPVFNQKRVVERVKAQQGRLLCDVLLDQTIVPGSGNIIKNEALFDSCVKPSTKVEELEEAHISHLIKMLRDFTMIFYKCRKTGKPLKQHLRIYARQTCGQCQGKVTICRLGDDNGRVTFFCEVCQNSDWRNIQKKSLSANTLLGWVHSRNSVDAEWTCPVCTLINQSCQKNCTACLTSREQTSKLKCAKTVDIITLSQGSKRKKENIPEDQDLSSKRQKIEKGVECVPKACQQLDPVDSSKIPLCQGHKKKCSMTEVRKAGPNNGRWFFSCSVSNRKQQCNFFQWADTSFPTCEGHGKHCTIRTVMKLGPNNGKKFFACSQSKKKQCKFFQWANGYG